MVIFNSILPWRTLAVTNVPEAMERSSPDRGFLYVEVLAAVKQLTEEGT